MKPTTIQFFICCLLLRRRRCCCCCCFVSFEGTSPIQNLLQFLFNFILFFSFKTIFSLFFGVTYPSSSLWLVTGIRKSMMMRMTFAPSTSSCCCCVSLNLLQNYTFNIYSVIAFCNFLTFHSTTLVDNVAFLLRRSFSQLNENKNV